MSNTHPVPGPARRLLAPTRNAPRKLRIAGLAGLITLGGSVALVVAPAAANAATFGPNPTCAVPAGVSYQLVQVARRSVTITQYRWEAFSNGVYYNGQDLFAIPPDQARAEGLPAACSTSSTPTYPVY